MLHIFYNLKNALKQKRKSEEDCGRCYRPAGVYTTILSCSLTLKFQPLVCFPVPTIIPFETLNRNKLEYVDVFSSSCPLADHPQCDSKDINPTTYLTEM